MLKVSLVSHVYIETQQSLDNADKFLWITLKEKRKFPFPLTSLHVTQYSLHQRFSLKLIVIYHSQFPL